MEIVQRLPVVPFLLVRSHLRASLAPCGRAQIRYASSSSGSLATSSADVKDRRKAYSHTLLLPKTTFPLKQSEPAGVEETYRPRTADELYRAQYRDNPGPVFVLHDGPPYANGNLHMGHALNRILKDIINRYQVIRGRKVHYIPGWDCHGLPIEMKALEASKQPFTELTPARIRSLARQTANEAITVQKREMRDLGIMADWDNPKGVYTTMSADFEARQLNLFRRILENGFISHRLRPVYYSPATRTALAEAELVYQDGHKSRSVYVGFPVAKEDMSEELAKVYDSVGSGKRVQLAIWTTTAWSLPGNSGVAVDADMEYCLVAHGDGLLLVAQPRIELLKPTLQSDLQVVGTFKGSDLVGTTYTHLFHPPTASSPRPTVFASTHVTSDSGTGLVHSAPAHGHEDYLAFYEAGIMPSELRCPIDDAGCFTPIVAEWAGDVDCRGLVGKAVLQDGTREMIKLLQAQGCLLAEVPIEHRYPYDWKSKTPIIVRATPQWFADVEAIKHKAIASLRDVNFVPKHCVFTLGGADPARNRLEASVMSRSEWCISRQRSWGLPIPVLYTSDREPILDMDSISHNIRLLSEKGTDYWWDGPIEDFLLPHQREQGILRGRDTLDVWFDSGSSWGLLEEAHLGEGRSHLADVYLEGSDQHRGWFQSSLLTYTMVSDKEAAPYKDLITHGFVMDEEGQKMSKSAGNGISPMDVVHGSKGEKGKGADVLRIWAASTEYSKDVSIGQSSIGHAAESLRKVRSTMRFMLANMARESPGPTTEQSLVDRCVLNELIKLESSVTEGYDSYAFNRVLQNITTFTSSILSTFYFDIVKDTLYCDAADDARRMAICQTLHQVFQSLLKMIAPIAPHLAEELYEHAGGDESSVFLDLWESSVAIADGGLEIIVDRLIDLRSAISSLCEVNGLKKSEMVVSLEGRGNLLTSLVQEKSAEDILGVASVKHGPRDLQGPIVAEKLLDFEGEQIRLSLSRSHQHQCPRCWKRSAESDDQLCARCADVVQR